MIFCITGQIIYVTNISCKVIFFPKNLKEKISKETLKKVDIEEENKAKKNNTDVILNKAQNKAFEEVKNSTNNKILLY